MGGGEYKKKTGDAMCTELGPGKPYLQQYIEEYGGTSLCSVTTQAGCTDKEKTFIETWKKKLSEGSSAADVEKQISRLQKMTDSAMKEELMQWVRQRLPSSSSSRQSCKP